MRGRPEQILTVLQEGRGMTSNTVMTNLTATAGCSLPDMMDVWKFDLKIPIVKDRDFVICSSVVHEPVHAIVATSVPEELATELSPPTKKYKRGKVLLQITIVEPTDVPGETVVKSVACVDPGGSLPNVKKMLAKAAASSLIKLQSTVENEIDAAPADAAPIDAAPAEMQHAAPDSPTASLRTCEGSTQALQQGWFTGTPQQLRQSCELTSLEPCVAEVDN